VEFRSQRRENLSLIFVNWARRGPERVTVKWEHHCKIHICSSQGLVDGHVYSNARRLVNALGAEYER
jgi:hypothetical protein